MLGGMCVKIYLSHQAGTLIRITDLLPCLYPIPYALYYTSSFSFSIFSLDLCYLETTRISFSFWIINELVVGIINKSASSHEQFFQPLLSHAASSMCRRNIKVPLFSASVQ